MVSKAHHMKISILIAESMLNLLKMFEIKVVYAQVILACRKSSQHNAKNKMVVS